MRTLQFLGAGRAGVAIARLLHQAGVPVQNVVTRSHRSAQRAVARIGAGTPGTDPRAVLADSAVVVLAVPDQHIAAFARELAKDAPPQKNTVALHFSGALSSEVLAPLRSLGIEIGSVHPVYAFADASYPPATLAGCYFGIEGESLARAAAEEMVSTLGGIPLHLNTETKPLHHAAAAVASNALVALFHYAGELEERAGADRASAQGALLALMQSTLQNLAERGSPAALTGPIERGEVDVIKLHRDALQRFAPEHAEFYQALARATLDVAKAKRSLSSAQAIALEASLGKSS